MGLFSSLFSSGSSKPLADEPGANAGYAELMAYGKRKIFAKEMHAAVRVFSRASTMAAKDPLPLAYRSWAGRLEDKKRAIADARAALKLDPSCAEAYMSLALALVTGSPDFQQAGMALNDGMKELPHDAEGAVLMIGVYLSFVDAITSMTEDAQGLNYDFKATPLRNAADWLLSGELDASFKAFDRLAKTGQQVAAATGMAAVSWAQGNKIEAHTCADLLIGSKAIKSSGLLYAIDLIRDASKQ